MRHVEGEGEEKKIINMLPKLKTVSESLDKASEANLKRKRSSNPTVIITPNVFYYKTMHSSSRYVDR